MEKPKQRIPINDQSLKEHGFQVVLDDLYHTAWEHPSKKFLRIEIWGEDAILHVAGERIKIEFLDDIQQVAKITIENLIKILPELNQIEQWDTK